MKIGGKERKIKCGMNQSILYCELSDISITQMNKEFVNLTTSNGSEIRDLVWSALKDGARIKKEAFEYTNFDVGDWMEDLNEKDLEDFIKDMTDTLPKSKKKVKTK